ncbi:MAG: Asp-tRNA(Asn)/Glu-tRNA(Gln) amidotransferase GatCAB subunit B, partial [Alphaproteobacteria bacterium]|nr:Asp-tRNA(Asn)/Glu-tRNA(Gln) amidotransferase GatCAB subunit B [Alphaproteobacteria bacterium]
RQIDVIEDGGAIVQETRLFDVAQGVTRSMRSKEEAHDYRYFPDPDLLPLELEQAWVDEIRASLPELPDDKKSRLMADFGLSVYDAGVMVTEPEIAAYYEAVADGRDPKQAANWVTGSLFAALNDKGLSITESPVSAAHLGKLVDLIADGTISGRIAKDVFEIMVETGGDPARIVEEKGLKQITDTGFIEGIVDKVIADNPAQVEQYAGGANPKVIGWFVGQVMKQSQGKANPGQVNELLKKKLG